MELALPRPLPLIEEARERQRRRRTRLALAAVAVATLATAIHGLDGRPGGAQSAAAPERAALPDPCTLLTKADVAKAFGARVDYRTARPQDASCTWSGSFPHQVQLGVTLDVAATTRAEFAEAFSTFVTLEPEPVSSRILASQRIPGAADAALAQSFAGTTLFVWYGSVAISITTHFVGAPLAAEKRLAAAAVARLRASETT